jgi:hypothetical protein
MSTLLLAAVPSHAMADPVMVHDRGLLGDGDGRQTNRATFLDRSGKAFESQDFWYASDVTAPAVPDIPGYRFYRWSFPWDSMYESFVTRALYEKVADVPIVPANAVSFRERATGVAIGDFQIESMRVLQPDLANGEMQYDPSRYSSGDDFRISIDGEFPDMMPGEFLLIETTNTNGRFFGMLVNGIAEENGRTYASGCLLDAAYQDGVKVCGSALDIACPVSGSLGVAYTEPEPGEDPVKPPSADEGKEVASPVSGSTVPEAEPTDRKSEDNGSGIRMLAIAGSGLLVGAGVFAWMTVNRRISEKERERRKEMARRIAEHEMESDEADQLIENAMHLGMDSGAAGAHIASGYGASYSESVWEDDDNPYSTADAEPWEDTQAREAEGPAAYGDGIGDVGRASVQEQVQNGYAAGFYGGETAYVSGYGAYGAYGARDREDIQQDAQGTGYGWSAYPSAYSPATVDPVQGDASDSTDEHASVPPSRAPFAEWDPDADDDEEDADDNGPATAQWSNHYSEDGRWIG